MLRAPARSWPAGWPRPRRPRPAPAAAPAKPKAKAKPKQHKAPQSAGAGALGTLGDLLGSSQGKAIQKEVARGVFGMLKKRL